jgi:hypothetical protein
LAINRLDNVRIKQLFSLFCVEKKNIVIVKQPPKPQLVAKIDSNYLEVSESVSDAKNTNMT